MHQPFLDNPPYSQHTWRQTLTLSVADNYLQEDNNLFRPRINNRGTTEGVTGMHFPLYEWTVAQVYRVVGSQFWVHRLLSFLLTVMGAWFLVLITNRWFGHEATGLIAGIFYLFSPEVFFNGFIALPDAMGLPMVLMGLWYFMRWWDSKRLFYLLLATIGILLGGLIKLQYLGIGFFIVGMLIRDWKQLTLRDFVYLLIFGLLTVAPVLGWYKYSTWLIAESGMADVGLELKPADSWSFALYVLYKNIVMDLPEVLLGYVASFGLVAGIYQVIRSKQIHKQPLFWPFLIFTIGFSCYHIMELKVLEHHQYYMMPYLPLLIPFAARGLTNLVKRQEILAGMMVLTVVLCGLRMIPARFNGPTYVPEAFWQAELRSEIRQALKPSGDETLIITGPDESMCINFFFLNSQGWSFRDSTELLAKDSTGLPAIGRWAKAGAKYYVSDDQSLEQIPGVKKWLKPDYRQIGEFRIYKLQSNSN